MRVCTQAAALPSIGPLITSNNLDAKSNGHGSSPLEMMLRKLIIICFLYILIVLGQTLQSLASSINLKCKLYKGRMEPVYKRSMRRKEVLISQSYSREHTRTKLEQTAAILMPGEDLVRTT
jgi:hypothetical protein